MRLKDELEDLLGVVAREDDYTVLLYKALKDSPNKKSLLKYRAMCFDNNLERRLEEIANRQTTAAVASKNTDIRSSFAELLGAGRSKPL